MAPGPHVFGNGRQGLWVAENSNLTDKLKHFLPRLRGPLPGLTDIFLPPSAVLSHKQQCVAAGFFVSTYIVAHSDPPAVLADKALAHRAKLKSGAIEFNLEGAAVQDPVLKAYATALVKRVRAKAPNLPIRLNVVPFKGYVLPVALINDDPQLFVIAQAYGGNMDILFAADEIEGDLLDWGIARHKVSVQHAVMCRVAGSANRQITVPSVRNRGSFYIDDLLLDAGLLP